MCAEKNERLAEHAELCGQSVAAVPCVVPPTATLCWHGIHTICPQTLLNLSHTTAAARASKGDIAWRLLHDASMAVGKEQAVLLPELRKVRESWCWCGAVRRHRWG